MQRIKRDQLGRCCLTAHKISRELLIYTQNCSVHTQISTGTSIIFRSSSCMWSPRMAMASFTPVEGVKLPKNVHTTLQDPPLQVGFGRKKSKTSKKISSVNDKTICMHLHAGRDSSIGMVSSVDLAVDSDESVPLVKMCGITTVHDAVLAAKAGAKFIGMILWPKSKRSVSLNVAKEISKAAREHGAEPVGVFVEEDAKEIEQACDATNIAFVQLHGDRARSALSNLVQHRHIIYVLHADKDGELLTKPPNGEYSDLVDWLLIDSLQGGSGKKFDWEKFRVPIDASKYGWLLAGGVDPENVSQAISILRPDAVDVSSGICAPDGIRKDPARVASFMNAVRQKKWKEF